MGPPAIGFHLANVHRKQKEAPKITNPEERHEHAGRSSEGLLDPEKVINEVCPKRGDAFLDVGCGEGHFSIAASKMVKDEGRVYAVDIHGESITILKREIARKNIGNVEAFTADITKRTPLEDGSIDVCLMANVLHGFVANREVDDTLKEITRLLTAGGTLAVVDFKKIDDSLGPPVSIRLTPKEVKEIITPRGFKCSRVIEAGPYHYTVIFKAIR